MEHTDLKKEQEIPVTSVPEKEMFEKSARKLFSGIVAVYLLAIFAVFPLYFHNYYYDILTAKYQFYWISTIVMLAACLVVGIVFMVRDIRQLNGYYTRQFCSAFRLEQLKKQPFAYKAVAVFWVLTLISTILSDYVYESFWGNEGRYSGLFLITLYILSTVVIGKFGHIRKWHLDVFLVSSVVVCLLGITDYFQMNFLGWKTNVDSEQANLFVSTLGNVNTYTAFVALTMAVASGCFVTEKNVYRRIWYYLVIALAFFSLVTGQSDNAYLSLGILFAVIPLFLFTTWKGIADYGILMATFITVIKIVDVVNQVYADRVVGFDGLFGFLANYRYLEGIVAAFWLLAGVLYFISRKKEKMESAQSLGRKVVYGWCAILAIAFVGIVFVLYDANIGGHAERYSALSQYLVFNDDWGTLRGYCWRIGWESYRKQSFLHQLFGFGPDTYGILTWDFREDALSKYGMFYESAHNEYFQYLVTIGPFALASYLAFLGGACVRMCKAWKRHTWILAPLLAVLCYGAQATVNINLPIATPIMWALLAVGLSLAKTEE